MAGNKFGARGFLVRYPFQSGWFVRLSNVDVVVGVLASFESVLDFLVVFSKLRHVTRNFVRVFAFDYYSSH